MLQDIVLHECGFYCSERLSRLLVPFADQHVEISSLTAGNIALAVGLKQVETLRRRADTVGLVTSQGQSLGTLF